MCWSCGTLCEVTVKKEKYCIKCGAVLPEEASFCPCCTASQMERRPVVAPPPNGGRKRRRVWLCAALALLLAGAGIWALTGGRAVGYDPPVPDPQQPDSLEGTLKQDTGQVWYDGADGTLYHVFACFSPQPDGGGVPASHRKELLLRGEESSSPLCLFVVKADDREEDVRAAFSALVERHTIQAVAQEGDACVVDAATDNYAGAGALYAHEHHVTSKCTYNDIIWTLYMKNGDEITLRQVVECGEQPVQSYSWEDTALDTTEALQTLLDRLTEEVSFETAVTIYLPAVTYDQPLTIRRPVKLVAHDDGTTFASPVTVERLPENTVVDMHVVLQGCRLRGSGGTGIKAQAPTYLDHCEISGWDVGALAADGGWIWVQRSDFSRNGVALCIDTNGSSSWSSNIYGGRFIRNGTAIRLAEMPGDWMTLRVHESAFYDNDTLLDNLCGAEVAFDENCLEQTA